MLLRNKLLEPSIHVQLLLLFFFLVLSKKSGDVLKSWILFLKILSKIYFEGSLW